MTFKSELVVYNNSKIFCFINVIPYRVVVSYIDIIKSLFKFSRDDEIVSFKSEIRKTVVSNYDTKENLYLKF